MQNSYPFASGTIKSLENKILKKTDTFKLKGKSISNCILSLQETGFGDNGLTIDEMCENEFNKCINTLKLNSPKIDEVELFYLIKDSQNIKMLLKSKYFNIQEPLEHASSILDFNTLKNKIFNNIDTEFKHINKSIDLIFDAISKKSYNAFELSQFIDQTVFDYCLKNTNSECIRSYLKSLIDYTNFTSLLRVFNLGWSKEELSKVLFNNGNFDTSIFIKAYDNTFDNFTNELKNISKDFETLCKCYLKTKKLSSVERMSNQLLLNNIKTYSNDADSVGPLMYYYLEVNASIYNVKKVVGSTSVELNDLLDF